MTRTTPYTSERFVRDFQKNIAEIPKNPDDLGTEIAIMYIEAQIPTEVYSKKFLRLVMGADETPKKK
jgi:hypothetical protein